jgi:hypothetical protein
MEDEDVGWPNACVPQNPANKKTPVMAANVSLPIDCPLLRQFESVIRLGASVLGRHRARVTRQDNILYNTETHYCDGAACKGCEHLIEEENLAMIEFSVADAERRGFCQLGQTTDRLIS